MKRADPLRVKEQSQLQAKDRSRRTVKSIPNRRDSLAGKPRQRMYVNKTKMDKVTRAMLKESHVASAKYTFRKKVKRNDDMEEHTFISYSASASRTQEVDVPVKRLTQRSPCSSRSRQEENKETQGDQPRRRIPNVRRRNG